LDLFCEYDDFGYWKGPEARITSTASTADSNFPEIIQTAGDAVVKGGITRPISGIIGNIEHRWFGEDTRVDDARRDIDESTGPQNSPLENLSSD
jgi:hypothetical protein